MNESAITAHDPFTTSLAGRRLGRYEVLARLASGGMAGVYVSRALGVAGFERLFAIKVLHPHLAHEEEFVTMFLDEARLAARIRHPNVVPTIDISDTNDAGYFLVMDYIEGDHLGALLQTAFKGGSRLPWPTSLRIVVDSLDGLAAAHNLTDDEGRSINLVHRDISPHNIMVGTDGISRITDFGVAKAEVRLSTTREGQFKGKLAYMAPEHASNGNADQRSDLFAMAIILWECLTGARLFRAENHAATLNMICLEPIPMPSEVDPELAVFDEIMQRALARDPEQRYQTAEEFADAIEQGAPALGGLAHQRVVAKMVKEYASEKIVGDAEMIRSAISAIAQQVSEAPPPPTTPAPQAAVSGPAPTPAPQAPPEAAVASAAVSGHPQSGPPADGRKRTMWIAGAVMLAIAVGLGLAVAVSEEGGGRVTTSPLQSVHQEPAAQPTPTPEPQPTPPIAPTEPTEPTEPTTATGEPAVDPGPTAAPKPAEDDVPRSATPPKPRRPRAEPRTKVRHDPPPAPTPRRKKKKDPEIMLNPYRN